MLTHTAHHVGYIAVTHAVCPDGYVPHVQTLPGYGYARCAGSQLHTGYGHLPTRTTHWLRLRLFTVRLYTHHVPFTRFTGLRYRAHLRARRIGFLPSFAHWLRGLRLVSSYTHTHWLHTRAHTHTRVVVPFTHLVNFRIWLPVTHTRVTRALRTLHTRSYARTTHTHGWLHGTRARTFAGWLRIAHGLRTRGWFTGTHHAHAHVYVYTFATRTAVTHAHVPRIYAPLHLHGLRTPVVGYVCYTHGCCLYVGFTHVTFTRYTHTGYTALATLPLYVGLHTTFCRHVAGWFHRGWLRPITRRVPAHAFARACSWFCARSCYWIVAVDSSWTHSWLRAHGYMRLPHGLRYVYGLVAR